MSMEDDTFDPPDTANSAAGPSPTDVTKPDAPPVDPARVANVAKWTKRIKDAKSYFDKDFKRMKECQKLARTGAGKDWGEDNYTVAILGRDVNVSVAALYARNPTAIAKRKKKVEFKLWDGDYSSLMQAYQSVVQAGQGGVPPDPNAMALIAEVQGVRQKNVQLDRMGKTLEILWDYYLNEQDANYKAQMKSWVRRAKVNGVGYITLGFQRQLQMNPDVTMKMEDVTSKIAMLRRLTEEQQDGEIDENSAELDQLNSLLADLQATQSDQIVREGPVLGFPGAREIIVDPNCRNLRTLVGAGWVAQEFDLDPDKGEEIFGVDVGGSFTAYRSGEEASKGDSKDSAKARFWAVQDKNSQQTFVICDGYKDFIKAPASPDVRLDRFWTVFPLVFNESEDCDTIYPLSDVWNGRHMQREYNSIKQALREHRIQNRPKYATPRGKLEQQDKDALAESPSGTVIELNSMGPNDDVGKILQPIKTVGIDPNLYETSSIMQDVTRTIGSQDADFGQTNSASATQSSIVQQSQSTTQSSNVDEIDEVLTELARALSSLMLLELDPQTVQEIAGDGAIWPVAHPTRQQVAKDLWLEIKAGSSGRPNRAADLANMERGLPYLLQIPGINPFPLGKRYGDLLDLDVDDIVIEGMPSIVAQNAMAQRGAPQAQPGSGGNDPNAQGPAGAGNAPVAAGNEQGPQPAYPAPQVNAGVPAPAYVQPKVAIGPSAAVLLHGGS